jgi:hypothetical protein
MSERFPKSKRSLQISGKKTWVVFISFSVVVGESYKVYVICALIVADVSRHEMPIEMSYFNSRNACCHFCF